MAVQTPAQQLYDLLVSRNFELELLDSTGRPSTDPSETEIFSFDFTTESGNDYGTVVIMLGDDNDMEIYFGDNVGKSMEGEDKKEWFDFLYQLRMFAKRNLMTFGLKNLNRLRYSMQGQAAIKESLYESWTGKRDVSYNAGPNQSRLMIKHKRALGEDEARFRYVESLFIETVEGERYKLPFRNLTAGKAMLEHVRTGGRPYDARGQHIIEMVNELNVLSRFRRANHGKIFEGDTAALVEQTNHYYETARRTLKSLSTRSGYETYFESWNPQEITEQEMVIEGIKHLFITQTLDQRIEEALPILARIQQQGTDMKEANIFEAWANQLVKGTWALPETPGQQAELVALLSKELPVGADATNATEQLYSLIGDDQLFDELYELARRDANADARQLVLNRLQDFAEYPEVAEVIAQLNIDTKTMNQPAQDQEEVKEIKDPETQTEDPAGTQENPYPEYQQDLMSMLKQAGVPAKQRPAPDYKTGVSDQHGMAEDAQPGVVADFSLEEGRMKELSMDLHDLTDSEFLNKYGKTKVAMQKSLGERLEQNQYDEGILGSVAGGALGGALGGMPGARIGVALGNLTQDALDKNKNEEVEENTFGQNLPAKDVPGKEKLLKTPVTPAEKAMAKLKDLAKGMSGSKDVEHFGSLKQEAENLSPFTEESCTCSEGACAMHEQGASCTTGNPALEEATALQGQYGHSGRMQTVTSQDPDILDRLKMLAGVRAN
jgi:hypothetical protein